MNGTAAVTFAQFVGDSTTGIVGVLNMIVVPIIIALAFLVFIWGIVNYFFLSVDNESKREQGKQFVFWGILGMVVMFSVWGLVNILLSTLGLL